jgi:signal transduction histidine kinase/DNA-binding NarL/FixJ family response regulator
MTIAANYTSTSLKEVPFRQFARFRKFRPKATKRSGKRKASRAARLAQDLARLRAEMRGVLELVPTGVLVVDSKGRIRFLNERLGELFELGERRIAKVETFEELAEMLRGHFRGAETFAFRWKERGATVESDELEMVRPVTRVISRKSGPVVVAQKHARDRKRGMAEGNSSGGKLIGWREVYEDITGQRHFQSKMLQTEKMAALGQLVSGIAHELNNPLTGIMGYAQLLLGRALDPKGLAETKNIYNEAERARRIVKNLLFFARESKPERMRSDLNEIVEKALALRSYELKVQNIAVEVNLQPNLPVTMADPYQLQQVVLNLLVNAEQALLQDRGSGRVSISTFTTPAGKIALEIADDGPGIPEEIASRIFDPFFSTKPAGVGTGLGLSIVYGIVKQHGGEVIAENLRTGGARFVVELPVVRPTTEEKSAKALAVARTNPKASRILVVEDEPTVARLITEVLGEEGHQVDAATDSQEGLTRLSRQAYDAVICDLRMPRLDGPAFYESLVRSGNPVKDRMLFVTGDTLGKATREFLEPRKLPFLEKPFLVEELKLAVDQILEKAASAQQVAAGGQSDFQSVEKKSGEKSSLPKLKKGGNGT